MKENLLSQTWSSIVRAVNAMETVGSSIKTAKEYIANLVNLAVPIMQDFQNLRSTMAKIMTDWRVFWDAVR